MSKDKCQLGLVSWVAWSTAKPMAMSHASRRIKHGFASETIAPVKTSAAHIGFGLREQRAAVAAKLLALYSASYDTPALGH